ncbi:MFS transporter [Leptospira stimsonii]|uniref:MFS transporter n=1 Tax=Leptospira stimsonii TaxID=2202203 RepID=A0ABY2MX22_9LEPT|nr:MFS transporter [Leptospira stimsonii]TGK23805.1 MFS transporter [Leptospira stimsonii]TGM10487.1 MFS transporter [Leptospira stimsonii]
MTKQESLSLGEGLFSKKSLIYFYINTAITLLAGNMFNYTLIIYSLDVTQSQTFAGSIFFANVSPTILFSFFVGAILDRYSRLKILYLFQTNFIVSGVILGILILLGKMNYELRYILILLSIYNGIALTFIIPGRLTLLGNLVDGKDTAKATMMLNILIIIGFGLAPMFVGLIKQKYEWYVLFFFISSLYFVGYLSLTFVKIKETVHTEKETIWFGLKRGFVFLRSESLSIELLILTMFAIFMVGPMQVVLPQFAKNILFLNERERGLYMGMLGLGLLIGGIAARLLHDRFHRGYTMLGATFLSGLTVLAVANFPVTIISAFLLLFVGVLGGLLSALIPSTLQIITPDNVRGRVMSFYSLVFQATPAISGLITGKLADNYGQPWSIGFSGGFIIVCSIFCAISFAKLRAFR